MATISTRSPLGADISTSELAAEAVTEAKIADEAVTPEKTIFMGHSWNFIDVEEFTDGWTLATAGDPAATWNSGLLIVVADAADDDYDYELNAEPILPLAGNTTTVTFQLWLNYANGELQSAGNQFMFGLYDAAGTHRVILYTDSTAADDKLRVATKDGTTSNTKGDFAFTRSTWYDVKIVFNGTTSIDVYFGDTQVVTADTTNLPTAAMHPFFQIERAGGGDSANAEFRIKGIKVKTVV